jgi:hypothetical protein
MTLNNVNVGDLVSPIEKDDLYADPYRMDPDIDSPCLSWNDNNVGMVLQIFDLDPATFTKVRIAAHGTTGWTYLDFIRKI